MAADEERDETRSATGLPVVAGPESARSRPSAAAAAGADGRPPLGTVMLGLALGEILAAIVVVAAIVALAAADVPDAVAIGAAALGYLAVVAVWAWTANGMLRALSGWEPGRAAALCAVAIGTTVAGALVLALSYALRDAPLVVSGTLASALYVLAPSLLLPHLAPSPPRWALAGAAVLVVIGAAGLGMVVADELS